MSVRSPTSGTETTSVPSATVDDLDLERFKAWMSAHAMRLTADEVTLEDALLQLRLATMMGSRLHPTIAGLYVFGFEPQFALPQLSVVTARFAGIEVTDDIVERGSLSGSLAALVDGAMSFVNATSRELVNQVDPEQSALEFPRRAVREAIVNALVHRDLRAGGPVAVRSFDDRIEIWSPGGPSGLPEQIQTYTVRGGMSLPPNPLVALLARTLGLADQLGRGLPLMRRLVEDDAHGRLQIVGSKEGVLVTIPSALDLRASRTDLLAN